MEQSKQVLPEEQEKSKQIEVGNNEKESPLLDKIRQQYRIYGGISILFGILFAFSFYKADIGLNVFFFTMVMIGLLILCMNRLNPPLKKGTLVYYAAASLFSLSTVLTASDTLSSLNFIAILCLLDLSLLHQLHEKVDWDVSKYFAGMAGVFFRGLASLGMPFSDSVRFLKHSKLSKNEKYLNVFLGVLIALPLLGIITALLSGADLLFGDMTKQIYEFFFSADIIGVVIMILFGYLSCYCILCGAANQADRSEEKARKKAASAIAETFVFLISLIYILFCIIQIAYLFAGGLFILPDGYTFAEYARRGFFELLGVTVINIVIILVCNLYFQESRLLRIFLTGMTVCTYIMIASAAYRMLLYIDAYHLTFLRLFVLLTLLIDALILAGVIIAVYHSRFPLFRYCTLVVTICYLTFSFAKPDYFIASYLINRQEILTMEDAQFITQELSADAAAAVIPVLVSESRWNEEINYLTDQNQNYENYNDNYGAKLDNYRESYFNQIQTNAQLRGFRDFNFSLWNAEQILKDYTDQ